MQRAMNFNDTRKKRKKDIRYLPRVDSISLRARLILTFGDAESPRLQPDRDSEILRARNFKDPMVPGTVWNFWKS
jgi:hypothetical protein